MTALAKRRKKERMLSFSCFGYAGKGSRSFFFSRSFQANLFRGRYPGLATPQNRHQFIGILNRGICSWVTTAPACSFTAAGEASWKFSWCTRGGLSGPEKMRGPVHPQGGVRGRGGPPAAARREFTEETGFAAAAPLNTP